MMSQQQGPTCECTSTCGDDERVQRGRVLGCAEYRMARNPAALLQIVGALSHQLAAVLDLMDRMEPDIDEADRASDDEWIDVKAQARSVLESVTLQTEA